MLSKNEILRYSRHIRLSEIGEKGQEKIKNARVLVVGVGGLGCPILQYLAAAGVGILGILDYDLVDESNLQRQILFDTGDVGKPKVLAAQKKLSAQNPYINLNVHFLKLTKNNALDIFKDYDIIVEGSDNFPTRFLTNDACVILNKPLVYGAVERFGGQLTVFNYQNGPTLRCLCPEPPDPFDVPSCSVVGILGVLPGIIGVMQASEVLKIITGVGEVLTGKILLLDALKMNFDVIAFSKNNETANITELRDYTDFCSDAAEIKKISSKDFQIILQQPDKVQVIDLRETDDCDNPIISSVSIPFDELSKKYLLVNTEIPVVFVCRYGIQSVTACRYMKNQHGFDNVYSLENGIAEWIILFGNS